MKVGVMLPSGARSNGRVPGWNELRLLATQAEAAGFDSLWVPDHLLSRMPGRPEGGIHEAWTLLAALAAATERVEIGPLVLCTPFRNPALTAKMAATLDEVGNGRLVLGLGAGWHEPEFNAFGYPFDHLGARFDEAFGIIRGLLRGERIGAHGTHHEASDAVLLPRPARRIPLLVAARGPRMLELTAWHADAWNAAWFALPDEQLAARRAALVSACERVGRDPATIDVTVGVGIRFADLLETAPGGPLAPSGPAGPTALDGGPDALAAAFSAYADLGVAQIMCAIDPATPEALERVAVGLAALRGFPAS